MRDLSIILCFISCTGCFIKQARGQEQKELNEISLSVSMPAVDPQAGRVEYYRFSHNLFYYGRQRAYNISDTMELVRQEISEQNQKISSYQSNKIVTDQWLFYFKDSTKGVFYDSLNTKAPRIVNADSCRKSFFGFEEKGFDVTGYRLLGSERLGTTMKETYAVIKKIDQTWADTLFYYYNKEMNDIEFSFSKKIDKEKSMKLVKIVGFYIYPAAIDRQTGKSGYRFEFAIDRLPPSLRSRSIIQRFEELRGGK